VPHRAFCAVCSEVCFGDADTKKKLISEGSMSRLIMEGEFPLSGGAFDIAGRKVLIRHRKEITDRKPELFLSAVDPYCYISSLYPADDGYTMDDDGKRYRVKVDRDSISFHPM